MSDSTIPTGPESQITIQRTSPKDIQQRQIIVKLDGEPLATLVYGRKVTRKIAPGPHRLHVDNTWARKTVNFDLAPGQHIQFQLINHAGRFTWLMVALLGAGPMYITVERETCPLSLSE